MSPETSFLRDPVAVCPQTVHVNEHESLVSQTQIIDLAPLFLKTEEFLVWLIVDLEKEDEPVLVRSRLHDSVDESTKSKERWNEKF